MDDSIYEGYWWLPDNEEHKVSGKLILGEKFTLHLEGNLANNKITESVPTHKIILGTVKNICLRSNYIQPQFITLNNCRCFNLTRHNKIKFNEEKYLFDIAFIERHFNNEEELKFYKFKVEYTNLTEWIEIPWLRYCDSISESQRRCQSINKQSYSLNVNLPDNIIANIDRGKILIEHLYKREITNIETELNLKLLGRIEIEPQEEISIEESLSNFISPLRDFLTFATNKPSDIITIYAYSKFGRNEVIEKDNHIPLENYGIKVELPLIKSDYRSKKPLAKSEMLFTCKEIKENFSLIMQKWFNFYYKNRVICNLYFVVKDNLSPFYSESQFLNLAQVIESYHRNNFNNQVLKQKKHNKSNEPTLAERIRELVDFHQKTMNNILKDKEQFITDVRNTRNYLTHYDQKKKNKSAEGKKLFRLKQRLDFLLRACFFHELGCDSDEIMEIFSHDREYQYLKYLTNLKE